MAELLESTMLVCFGLSWPMNLAKNIKAKSAKTMSLQFILLIIAGYIAGISAKIYNHKFNYVLAVYLLNLIIVSANLIVYFVNRRYDRMARQAKAASIKDLSGAADEKQEPRKNTSINSQGDDEMAK